MELGNFITGLWGAFRPFEQTQTHTHTQRVRAYYEQTDFQYQIVCSDSESMAMHFGAWDRGARNHRDAALRMNELLADAVNISPGDRVFDAGCGTGGSSLWLAKHRGARVEGVTIVPAQVRRGRRTAKARGLSDRCRFHLASYDDTGFEAASFDVCWIQESLCHSDRKDAVLRECRRLLRPLGRLVIADGFRTRRSQSAAEEERLGRFMNGWRVADLLTPDELSAAASREGFIDPVYHDVKREVLPDSRWLYELGRKTWPFARAFDRVGLIRRSQLENVETALLQYETFVEGLWTYGITTAHVRA